MFSEIIITVTDVDAAVAFYTDACRFEHVRTVVHQGEKVVEFDAGGQRVTVIGGAAPGIRLVMETGSVRADHRRLTRLGLDVGEEATKVAGGSWLGFQDPSGNALGYWKPETASKDL